MFADDRDVRFHFLVRTEETAENRLHSEQMKIIRGHIIAVQLNRITQAGDDEPGSSGKREERDENEAGGLAQHPEGVVETHSNSGFQPDRRAGILPACSVNRAGRMPARRDSQDGYVTHNAVPRSDRPAWRGGPE